MPRPQNLPIQGSVVRQLRQERGLSQSDLVTLVLRALPDAEKRHIPDRSSLERQCYEWEQDNNISRPRLLALCEVLGVPAERLQAPPSPAPSRIDEIVERLRLQLAAGNKKTEAFVASANECIHLGAVPPIESEDGALQVAAEAIEVRLGDVQLTGGLVELEELGALTGWTNADLLRPASVHAHWLVASESRLGGTIELVRGLHGACAVIKEEVQRWLHPGGGDSRVTLEEEAPWFRFYLQDPDRPQLDKTISVVRCEAQKAGLIYCSPTDAERWHLTVLNTLALRNSFNFVRPLGDKAPWPRYVDMALEIWDVSGHSETGELTLLDRFNGSLAERVEDSLPRLAEERHRMVMHWLVRDVEQHLLPLVREWPRECWTTSAAEQLVSIALDVPLHIQLNSNLKPTPGKKLAIQLVEVKSDGTSTPLPLATGSLEVLLEGVRAALLKLPLHADRAELR